MSSSTDRLFRLRPARQRGTVGRQAYVDIAADGVRVGAHLVRGGNEINCARRIIELRKFDIEFNRQLEAAILAGKQAHATVDQDVTDFRVLAAGDRAERALEAGRVLDGE